MPGPLGVLNERSRNEDCFLLEMRLSYRVLKLHSLKCGNQITKYLFN